MIKTLSVLGSTGSIGRQTIEVARHLGLAVTELTSYTNYRLLENQCREFKVRKAWIGEQYYSDLKILLADTGIKVFTGKTPFTNWHMKPKRISSATPCWE